MNNQAKIEISSRSILIFFGILLSLAFIWLTKDVLIILFLAVIIMATLSPLVSNLENIVRWRTLAVLLVYLIIGAILFALIGLFLPSLVSQTEEITNNLPYYTEQISWLTGYSQIVKDWWLAGGYDLQNVLDNLAQSSQQIFQFTGSIITVFGTLLVIIAISFYGLIAEKSIKHNLRKFLPKNTTNDYWKIAKKIYTRLGIWLRTYILIGITMGVIVGFGLWLIGIPYALAIGVLAGLMEIIPVIGPVFAALPALLIAFALSPWTGLFVLIFYIVIYQLEGYVLIPKIFQKTLGLSPVIVLITIVLGAKLGGILGVLVAVPVATVVVIIVQEMIKNYEATSSK